jgi:uncharacterized protein YvpB
MTQILKSKHFILAAAFIAYIFISTTAAAYAFTPVKLTYKASNVEVTSVYKIEFNEAIDASVKPSIQGTASGSWTNQKILLGVKALEFHPSKPLTPGRTYKISLVNIKKIGASDSDAETKTIVFNTMSPADIESVSPANASQNIPVAPTIKVKLRAPNKGLRKLQLGTDSPIKLSEPTTSDDQTFSWHFASALPQGVTIKLFVDDLNQSDPNKRRLSQTTFTTVAEPKITGATQTDHFYPGNQVAINFDQPMNSGRTKITFSSTGSGNWASPTEYIFTPTGLIPGSSYTYTVVKGSTDSYGGVTESDHTYSFSPPGAAFVISSSPRSSSSPLNSVISFTFDQPVDHSSAEAAFSITPNASGAFSWSGNTLRFNASLDYQTTYTASIKPAVKSVYGLPSVKPFSNSFSTVLQTINLNVPYFHQAYSLSCEEAALRMALSYRGISVSDFDILQRLNYSPRPRDTSSNSWDNPYQMYVGDVNGIQGSSGWGVYSPPIASAAESFGRTATAISGISVNQIADAIHNGNPVVLWGYSGSSIKPDSWNTSDGVVYAPKNEHTRTVVGVVGKASAPAGFYLNDPVFGRIFWTTAQMQFNMSFGGTQSSQGVIIY